MPTYVLEGGSTVTLPGKPLTLRIQGNGGTRARLVALRGGAPDHTAITPGPGMLVLPRVGEPVIVRAVPETGANFGSRAVVSLSAGIELHGDTDPERAVLSGVDLSGLAQRDLVEVARTGDRLTVTALGVIVDTPLPPLASRARDLAREILGAERVPTAEATELQLVFDASASMRQFAADGSIAAAAEVYAGISRVTSADAGLQVVIAAAQWHPLPEVAAEKLAPTVLEAITAHPIATGFRARGEVPSTRPQTVRCLISDGVPADMPIDEDLTDGHRIQVAVLAAPPAWEVMRHRCPGPAVLFPTAEWGPSELYQHLMSDDRALRTVVTELLRGILPLDSALQQRLGTPTGAR
ncbi:hypothetical protein [Granulicoccus phenolivorans]|uniref:hypothetical protein n=1 Tax=Granulicoccus phenolivorans TaxID=266854 RepID=UPI00040FBE2C|nr:hypothetical protein [Granulicoccus phenolivorans]